MSKVAIVTDSNSGVNQKEGEQLGIFIIPMPFQINEEEYFEDINLTREGFYDFLKQGAAISTSQPAPGAILDLWDKLLLEYDEIVHIPMSSGLSGATQSAMMLSDDYDGRVQVVDNNRVSVTQRQAAIEALELAEKGYSAKEIKEILEREKFRSTIYIMMDTLTYLKRGGRITPAAAALGNLLRIKPVLQIKGQKLDAFAKARTIGQAKTMMQNAIRKDIEEFFGGVEGGQYYIMIAHTENEEAAMELKKEIQENFGVEPVVVDHLALSIACHIGPGSLAIACTGKVPELQ